MGRSWWCLLLGAFEGLVGGMGWMGLGFGIVLEKRFFLVLCAVWGTQNWGDEVGSFWCCCVVGVNHIDWLVLVFRGG